MKKQFILSVIMSIIMLFTVNGQSLVNQQSRFTKRINNNEKVEPKEPELRPSASIKTNNINLKLKHNFRDIYTQRLDSIVYQNYDNVLMQLVNEELYEYTYDANNNMTSEIYSLWDTGINAWIFNYKYEYIYNLEVNISEIIAPEWYNNYLYPPFYNELLTEIYYSWDGTDFTINGTDFTINSKGTFYYSDIVGINEVIDNSIFIIYPNPANDYIMINAGSTNTNEIQIFNVYGQCLMSVDTQNNISEYRVDISNLPAGMYFTRIANDKNNVVKRFVKQ